MGGTPGGARADNGGKRVGSAQPTAPCTHEAEAVGPRVRLGRAGCTCVGRARSGRGSPYIKRECPDDHTIKPSVYLTDTRLRLFYPNWISATLPCNSGTVDAFTRLWTFSAGRRSVRSRSTTTAAAERTSRRFASLWWLRRSPEETRISRSPAANNLPSRSPSGEIVVSIYLDELVDRIRWQGTGSRR